MTINYKSSKESSYDFGFDTKHTAFHDVIRSYMKYMNEVKDAFIIMNEDYHQITPFSYDSKHFFVGIPNLHQYNSSSFQEKYISYSSYIRNDMMKTVDILIQHDTEHHNKGFQVVATFVYFIDTQCSDFIEIEYPNEPSTQTTQIRFSCNGQLYIRDTEHEVYDPITKRSIGHWNAKTQEILFASETIVHDGKKLILSTRNEVFCPNTHNKLGIWDPAKYELLYNAEYIEDKDQWLIKAQDDNIYCSSSYERIGRWNNSLNSVEYGLYNDDSDDNNSLTMHE